MKSKMFAQIAIALLLVSIFSILPVATTPLMFSNGKVSAVRFDAAGKGLPSSVTASSTDGQKPKMTYNLDMIDTENILGDGEGVYVAVIDCGLLPHWRYYFPEEKIVTEWATAFYWDEHYRTIEVPAYYDQALSGHGTHVSSTIIGFNYLPSWNAKAVQVLDGVAPKAKIIPIKALWWFDEYGTSVATWDCIATAIEYATNLAKTHNIKMVINLSLGGDSPAKGIENAIDKAIRAGVIVVAAAGNAGTDGMDWPGAYPQVISAGMAGWTGEWFGGIDPITYNPLWDEEWHKNDVPEDLMTPAPASALFGYRGGTQVYMDWLSGRELPGQDLDIAAPGSWVYGPYWTPFWGPLPADPSQCYGWVGGTSMASPHVAGTAALMLEKNPSLDQYDIEAILESTADLGPITYPNGYWLDPNPYMAIFALHWGYPPGWYYASWADDAVGEGFLDADEAVTAA
jgi:subtilisin family serine protease